MILRWISLTCLIRAGKEALDLEEVISADPGLTRDGDTAVSAALFIKQRMIQTKSRISMASVHLRPPANKRIKVVGGIDLYQPLFAHLFFELENVSYLSSFCL